MRRFFSHGMREVKREVTEVARRSTAENILRFHPHRLGHFEICREENCIGRRRTDGSVRRTKGLPNEDGCLPINMYEEEGKEDADPTQVAAGQRPTIATAL